QRVVSEFIELVQTSSPSRHELPVAQRLIPALEALGAQVEVDDAGSKIGGDTGNVLGRIPGTAPSAPPLLLCAHMDTVVPCQNIRPVAQGDVIRTDGTTILGRIDDETTANLGVIEGGLATNIVPNRVTIRGETRSRSLAKLDAQTEHMQRCFDDAAARHQVTVEGRGHTARVEARVARGYERLDLGDDTAIVRLMTRAAERLHRNFRTRATGG